jgi:flavin-dependent dehydrogenase
VHRRPEYSRIHFAVDCGNYAASFIFTRKLKSTTLARIAKSLHSSMSEERFRVSKYRRKQAQKHKTRLEGGPVSRQAGMYSVVSQSEYFPKF